MSKSQLDNRKNYKFQVTQITVGLSIRAAHRCKISCFTTRSILAMICFKWKFWKEHLIFEQSTCDIVTWSCMGSRAGRVGQNTPCPDNQSANDESLLLAVFHRAGSRQINCCDFESKLPRYSSLCSYQHSIYFVCTDPITATLTSQHMRQTWGQPASLQADKRNFPYFSAKFDYREIMGGKL